jgi:hypothetical protein
MPHDAQQVLIASRRFLAQTKSLCGEADRPARKPRRNRSELSVAIGQAKSILLASRAFAAQAKSATEGVWRTTEDGNRIFIKGDGDVRAGGPDGPVIATEKQKTKPTSKKPRKKKEVDPDSPFVPKTKVDQAIVEFVGSTNRELIETFRHFVDESYKLTTAKYLGDRQSAMEVLGAFGYNGAKASGFISGLRHKTDYTSIRGFDQMAEYAEKYYPEMLTADVGETYKGDDVEQALFNRLRGGFPNAPAKFSEEVLNLAAQMAGPTFFEGWALDGVATDEADYPSGWDDDLEDAPF